MIIGILKKYFLLTSGFLIFYNQESLKSGSVDCIIIIKILNIYITSTYYIINFIMLMIF